MPDAERSEPPKVGKPLEKSDAEKAKDEKLLKELAAEQDLIEHVETPEYTDWNPLAEQAERLPAGIKGADGFLPNAHVRDATGSTTPVQQVQDDPIDEDLGGGLTDPDSLTAD